LGEAPKRSGLGFGEHFLKMAQVSELGELATEVQVQQWHNWHLHWEDQLKGRS
jgi:hypothetical protein